MIYRNISSVPLSLVSSYVATINILFNVGDLILGWLFAIFAFYGYAYLPFLYISAQIFGSLSSLYSFLTYLFLIPSKLRACLVR